MIGAFDGSWRDMERERERKRAERTLGWMSLMG